MLVFHQTEEPLGDPTPVSVTGGSWIALDDPLDDRSEYKLAICSERQSDATPPKECRWLLTASALLSQS